MLVYFFIIIIKIKRALKEELKIFNIGNNKPEKLMTLVSLIQKKLNIKAKINYLDYQLGDTIRTSANINELKSIINYVPKTTLNLGIPKFIDWYTSYHK